MKIDIGGVKLWFDVEGAKLVPDGPEMKERPTLLLLHDGPGFDHPILNRRLRAFRRGAMRFSRTSR